MTTGARAQEQAAGAKLSAAQLVAFADHARARHEYDIAQTAYRALTQDREIEIRTEARFRLGTMFANDLKLFAEAALEFRRILDDKPDAARVRLELARMQMLLGNLAAARKELRSAQAVGLPSDVKQLVRFYSSALSVRKTLGGSIEISFAPDTNINRATRSSTLGTVIGDFSLNSDARAKSGVGFDLQGQGYSRLGVEPGVNLLSRVSASATLYREAAFNDVTVGVQSGPQYAWLNNQLAFSVGPSWRWYGRNLFSESFGANVSWQRTLGKRGQLRLDGGIAHVVNKRNTLQTADDITLSTSIDRAFSGRAGGGIQVYGFREASRDPGYSLASGGASTYLFRELGRTTLVGTLGYSRLEADERLLLYLRRRIENRYNASIGVTLRGFHAGTFARWYA